MAGSKCNCCSVKLVSVLWSHSGDQPQSAFKNARNHDSLGSNSTTRKPIKRQTSQKNTRTSQAIDSLSSSKKERTCKHGPISLGVPNNRRGVLLRLWLITRGGFLTLQKIPYHPEGTQETGSMLRRLSGSTPLYALPAQFGTVGI